MMTSMGRSVFPKDAPVDGVRKQIGAGQIPQRLL